MYNKVNINDCSTLAIKKVVDNQKAMLCQSDQSCYICEAKAEKDISVAGYKVPLCTVHYRITENLTLFEKKQFRILKDNSFGELCCICTQTHSESDNLNSYVKVPLDIDDLIVPSQEDLLVVCGTCNDCLLHDIPDYNGLLDFEEYNCINCGLAYPITDREAKYRLSCKGEFLCLDCFQRNKLNLSFRKEYNSQLSHLTDRFFEKDCNLCGKSDVKHDLLKVPSGCSCPERVLAQHNNLTLEKKRDSWKQDEETVLVDERYMVKSSNCIVFEQINNSSNAGFLAVLEYFENKINI